VAPEIDRLGRTVDDLLALSRADAGMAIAREPVDVLELADTVFSLGRRLPGGQRLILDLGDEPADWDWLVRGDEHLLQQLLLNLVDNALKYSPADAPVVLGLSAQPSTVTMSVSDRGAGIPPEEQERIFERFYRAPLARASGAPGSGLGLCLARWIAEAHGGQLTVDSEPGRGSVFRLRLPAWAPIAEPDRA
jgi:signal transduction histidine kinase